MAKDLNEFLNRIEQEHPDYFLRLKPTVNPHKFEITAFLKLLESQGEAKIVLFEKTVDIQNEKSIPFVSNVFASRGLCALALGLPYADSGMKLVEEFGKREQNPGQLETVKEAPSQVVIWQREEASLWKLPIPMHHKDDVGPYLTMTCIMKGLDKGFYDISFTKNWARGPQKMKFRLKPLRSLKKI